MALGSPHGGGGDDTARGLTATIMSQPLGRWLLALAGLVLILAGLVRIGRGWRVDLDRRLSLGDLPAAARQAVIRFGRIGFAAHGVVLGLIGGFLANAAIRFDPSEARGLGGALRTLAEQPYGPWLLGVVALGLVCYGVFEVVRARYRRSTPWGD
jgi:hypothetical protein